MARFCRFFLLPLLLLVITSFSSAQEGEPPPEGQNEPPENLSLTEDTLAQDILTASFRDLIA
ncbi:MAG: hypothetical protein ACLFNP_06685, partial [Spirochaetaceae bacterium]